jgi:protein-disulfide isomerase
VLLLVFSDFQCPFCARFTRDTLPQLEAQYFANGRAAFAFRHLPLAIHAQAMTAAVHADCAGQQGQFWAMHDRFLTAGPVTEDIFRMETDSLGLNREAFESCISDAQSAARITASIESARVLNVRSTPSFFVGRRLQNGRLQVVRTIVGMRPINEFTQALDDALADERVGWSGWIPFLRP